MFSSCLLSSSPAWRERIQRSGRFKWKRAFFRYFQRLSCPVTLSSDGDIELCCFLWLQMLCHVQWCWYPASTYKCGYVHTVMLYQLNSSLTALNNRLFLFHTLPTQGLFSTDTKSCSTQKWSLVKLLCNILFHFDTQSCFSVTHTVLFHSDTRSCSTLTHAFLFLSDTKTFSAMTHTVLFHFDTHSF